MIELRCQNRAAQVVIVPSASALLIAELGVINSINEMSVDLNMLFGLIRLKPESRRKVVKVKSTQLKEVSTFMSYYRLRMLCF